MAVESTLGGIVGFEVDTNIVIDGRIASLFGVTDIDLAVDGDMWRLREMNWGEVGGELRIHQAAQLGKIQL